MITTWWKRRTNRQGIELRVGQKRRTSQPRLEGLEERTLLSFLPAVNYSAGAGPRGIVMGDFNKDGNLDVVTANFTDNTISIFLGNGDGTLGTAVNFPVGGTGPSGLAVGDFNKDGNLDLVVADKTSNTVSVLLGLGNGTFAAPFTYAVGISPVAVAVGDFHGQGKIDIAVANQGSNNVSVLLGNGNGTFQNAINLNVGSSPSAVAVGDFDLDTKTDLVVANQGNDTVSVLLGNGNGTFKSPMNIAAGASPSDVVVGFLKGDNKPDVAVTDFTSNKVSILLGNGDGSFQTGLSFGVGAGPSSLAVADVDGDGKPDLVVTNQTSNNLSVLLGAGLGTFKPAVNYGAGTTPVAVAVGALTPNVAPDIVVANVASSNVSVLVNQPDVANFTITSSGSTVAGNPYNFTVTARDHFNHVVPTYAGTVHFTSSDPQASLPSDYMFVPGDGGIHVFTATLKTAGPQSLIVKDTTDNTIVGMQSGISVSPAATSTLSVKGFPATAVAGQSKDFVVSARDLYGNVTPGYTGTVKFSSNDAQATLPPNYSFLPGDSGTHTFSATLKTAGTNRTITATDTVTASFTDTQSGITILADAVANLNVFGYTSPATAGDQHTVTVTARDAFGNTVTSYVGTTNFSSSDGQAVLPNPYMFTGADAGTHTFNATLKTSGTQSITATDSVVPTVSGSQSGIVINAAALNSLDVAGFPLNSIAGTSNSFTVTAQDLYGNKIDSYLGTIGFTATDPLAVLPPSYTFVPGDAGSHTFDATLKMVGIHTITAKDVAGIAGSMGGLRVDPAPVNHLMVSGYPTGVVAGTAHEFSVKAVDPYGNSVPTYAGTIAFSSDSLGTVPQNYTFNATDNGTHGFAASLNDAGSRAIFAADVNNPAIVGIQLNIGIIAGPTSQFLVKTFPATTTAGDFHLLAVFARDQFGNHTAGYTGTVHFTSSDPKAILPPDYTFVPADNGASAFGAALLTQGLQSITAVDLGNEGITGTESGITVNSAALFKFVVSGFPALAVAGESHDFSVQAADFYGNIVTAYLGTVHFSTPDPKAILPANYTFTAADQGSHSFAGAFKTAGAQSITANDVANPALSGVQAAIQVNGAKATHFKLAPDVANPNVGQLITITLSAADEFENVANTYTGMVHVVSSDPLAGLPNDGSFVPANNGVVTFTATLNSIGTRTMTVTDTAFPTVTGSAVFNVSHTGTVTTLSSSLNPSEFNAPVIITIQVNAVAPGGGPPPGTITVMDGTTILVTGPLQNGAASVTVSSFTPGLHNLTAVYAGDGNYLPSTSAPLTQAVGTLSQRYVARVYQDLLHRPVDPSGLLFWAASLDQGIQPNQMLVGMETSQEYFSNVVQSVYTQYLHRSADLGGLAFWVDYLSTGATTEQLTSIIVGSQEYYNLHGGTNNGFLAGLYQDALKRPIDASGQAAFSQALTAGLKRDQMASILFASTEYQQILVRGFYMQALHRDADASGLNTFVNLLKAGVRDEHVLNILFTSGEYIAGI